MTQQCILDAVRYNSFNKTTIVKHGADSMRLWYGADLRVRPPDRESL